MKLSYNINNAGNRHEKYVCGVQKPRGLENAAIQRDKHNNQETKIAQPLEKKDDIILSLDTGELEKSITYPNLGITENNISSSTTLWTQN
jgi:hypothetical protein